MLSRNIFYFIVSVILYKLFRKYFSNYLLDVPSDRSSHKVNTPKGAGIIFAILNTFALINLSDINIISILTILCVSIIGLFDDIFNLKIIYRLISQIFLSIILVLNSSLIDFFAITNYFYVIFAYLLIIFISVAIINFINFMDGIDGFVSISFIFCLLVSSIYYPLVLIPLILCLIGFLFFNLRKSYLFMGDAGSTYLGSLLVMLVLNVQNTNNIYPILISVLPLLSDAVFTLLRRIYFGQEFSKPHRLHMYQRLYDAGFNSLLITLIYVITSLLLVISFLKLNFFIFLLIMIILFSIILCFDKKYALPFKIN